MRATLRQRESRFVDVRLHFDTVRHAKEARRRTGRRRSRKGAKAVTTPLDELPFPVHCDYPDCDSGPLYNADEVDLHITAEHGPEAIWTFADEHMKP